MANALRRELACALGESMSENPWDHAGVALEFCRSALERRLRGNQLTVNGAALDSSAFARHLFPDLY
jgi:hypothetical protein